MLPIGPYMHEAHSELSLLQMLSAITPIGEAIILIYTLASIHLLGRCVLSVQSPNTRGMTVAALN